MSAEELESCIASGMVNLGLCFQNFVMPNLRTPYELVFAGGKGDPQCSKTPGCSSCSLKIQEQMKAVTDLLQGLRECNGNATRNGGIVLM